MKNIKEKIKEVKNSIIAIGFRPEPNKMTIIGSGFIIKKDGEISILSSAHLYNKLKPEYISNLMGMVTEKEEKDGLTHYKWLPIKLIKKEDKDDIAIFQIENDKLDLLTETGVGLKLGDSEDVEVGEDVYFIGFPYAAQLINDGFGVTLIVNRGIISNIKRDGIDPSHKKNWFIVDAISNPGNSGCPLIKLDTNEVIGIMAISFRTKSRTVGNLDIREPMHIAGAKPINLAKPLLENL
jgi:S1-C subfamily serine protease